MTTMTFTAVGIPQPKGSARAFTYRRRPEKGGGIGARVDHDNPKTRQWERTVREAASRVIKPAAFICTGPVRLTVVFCLPRPQRLKHASSPHLTRPDCDKLVRALSDGMTGVCFEDDAQIVEIHAVKRYAASNECPCAIVRVVALDVEQQPLLQKGA